MSNGQALKRNESVPAGSSVCGKVSGPAGQFNADGQVVSGSAIVDWTNGQLVPGPVCTRLADPKSTYFVRVRIAFLAQATVTIEIQIKRPDGTTHSTPHKWTVSGKNGDVAIRGAFIVTG
jgi:hypothetical protein